MRIRGALWGLCSALVIVLVAVMERVEGSGDSGDSLRYLVFVPALIAPSLLAWRGSRRWAMVAGIVHGLWALASAFALVPGGMVALLTSALAAFFSLAGWRRLGSEGS